MPPGVAISNACESGSAPAAAIGALFGCGPANLARPVNPAAARHAGSTSSIQRLHVNSAAAHLPGKLTSSQQRQRPVLHVTAGKQQYLSFCIAARKQTAHDLLGRHALVLGKRGDALARLVLTHLILEFANASTHLVDLALHLFLVLTHI